MHRSARRYEFGPFKLNPHEGTLVAGGEVVTLAPKPFDVLRVLVERHGHVVLKSELMASIWPDTAVEEANLTVSVSVLRKALARRQPDTRYVQTVPKRGYRFVAEVREITAGESDLRGNHAGSTASHSTKARHFVGRERERASLHDSWVSAMDGTATFVTVSGEPGIGKTTLVEDFLDQIRSNDREALIARGRCPEHLAGIDPFLPLLQALEDLIEGDGARTALMKAYAPTWYAEIERSDATAFPDVTGVPAGTTLEGLFREVGRFLHEVALMHRT